MTRSLDIRQLQPGYTVGPYQIVRQLGGSGHSMVYEARRGLERVALKFVLFDLASGQEERARFEARARAEMAAVAQLESPYVVRVLDMGWWASGTSAFPYFAMEHVEGVPLQEWVVKAQPSLRELVELLVKVANTLARLHAAGLCHRDLRADNVLVRTEGEPVLTHLGLGEGRAAVALTVADVVGGQCRHVSPEFADYFVHGWRRGERYSHLAASDFHALGAVLYQALTGRQPFAVAEGDTVGLLQRTLNTQPHHPCLINPRVPCALGTLAVQLLSRRARERPRDGEELARALRRTLAEADSFWDVPFVAPEAVSAGSVSPEAVATHGGAPRSFHGAG